MDVVIGGNAPIGAREYVLIPETFSRRYAEMRSTNDLLALIASIGLVGFLVAGIVALVGLARSGLVRWRPAMVLGGLIGALMAAAALNGVPSEWFAYDTATSASTFLAQQVALAIGGGVAFALFGTLIVAAAEGLTRVAFPNQLDWWGYWANRDTRQVAGRVLGGYAVTAFGFGYVAVFYFVTRRYLGWWVPSELLDDPNQIATPLPWVGAIAMALEAGVLEECVFRAIPLALLSRMVGEHPRRRLIMACGVIVTALAFGFAHANYPSWPPYSRGVELVLEASLWAMIYLRFGLPVTIIGHFVFDLTLFGLFAASGSGLSYHITSAVVLVALATPAAIVLFAWIRRRSLREAGADARFSAWTPAAPVTFVQPTAEVAAPVEVHAATPMARRYALGVIAATTFLVITTPTRGTLGPSYTIGRAAATTKADSLLRLKGVTLDGWTRLSTVENYTGGARQRFIRANGGPSLAARGALVNTFQPAAAWSVRYVHTGGDLAQRAEEWRVRMQPNGALIDIEHVIPESSPAPAASADSVRAAALAAIKAANLNPSRLTELTYQELARPKRRDVNIDYKDTTVALPAQASARVQVSLAGTEPLLVRRRLELPESFRRTDEKHGSALTAATAVSVLVIAVVLIVGLIMLSRRPAIANDVAFLHKRSARLAILGLVVIQLVLGINGRPDRLFGYDTAMGWGTFTTMSDVALLLSVVVAAVGAGLWVLADMARRRFGIPVWPAGEDGAREALLFGCALGLVASRCSRSSARCSRSQGAAGRACKHR